jgi:hypothetical protein
VGFGYCPVDPGSRRRAMQSMTWQGERFPSVKTRFVCTHHAISQPSPASWWSASHRTGTFQGQLFHLRRASSRRDGPRAHRLPGQAMERSIHFIAVLRGARIKRSPGSQRSAQASPDRPDQRSGGTIAARRTSFVASSDTGSGLFPSVDKLLRDDALFERVVGVEEQRHGGRPILPHGD